MSAQIDFLWVLLGTIVIGAVALTFAAYIVISSRRELAIRIKAEKALEDSEQQYRRIIEEANDTVYTTDPSGYFLYINPPMQKLTGYSRDELIGMHFTELIPQDWLNRVQQFYIRQFEDRVRDTTLELPILTRTGEEKWVEQKVTLLTVDHRVTGFQSIVRDITKRKQAEELLRESEEKYRTIFENVSEQIVYLDNKGTIISANDRQETFGRKPEELVGKNFTELGHFDVKDVPKVQKLFKEIITGKKTINRMEVEVKNKDGNKIPVEVSTTLVKKNGKIEGFLCIVSDITERKRAEEEIQRQTEDLALINDLNNAIDHGKSLEEIIHILSRKTERMFSAYGAAIYLTSEDKKFLTMVQIPLNQKIMHRIEKMSGVKIPSLRIPLNAEGLHGEVIQAKKLLLINDQKRVLRWITELANFSNPTGKPYPKPIQLLIPRISKILGIRSTMVAPLISEGKIIGLLEISGNKPFVESDLRRLEILSRQMSTIIRRKQAEEGLLKSEDRYRTVVEDMPALICRFLPNGTLSFVNDAYCQYFGKKYEELVGHDFFQFIPAEDREKVREHYSSISKKKPAITYEHQVIAPDGTIRWQRWTDRGLFDESGAFVEYQSIGEDITNRKQAEEELRELSEQLRNLSSHLQSVSEKERMKIAREIHDELGQALTALQIDLYWLGERVPVGKEDLLQKINSMSDVVEAVIQSTQSISTELRPVLLDTIGLSAAIEWQVEEFQKRTGIQCEVVIDSADIDLDPDQSTAIFRILQESLTNVVRHADATEVWVGFNRHSDKLILEVVDNGKGISQDQISSSMAFGLIGMRERIRPWGGEFNISGTKGKGTTVTATISLDN